MSNTPYQIEGRSGRKLLRPILTVLFSMSAVSALAWTQATEPAPATVNVEHVGHLIGLEGIKPNLTGALTFDETTMHFKSGDLQSTVPLKAIRAFSVARDSVALIGGAKGAIVGLTPFGVGLASSAIRPSVDTLTLLYDDQSHALHGAILLLPTGKGEQVTKKLAAVGLTPRDYPKTGALDIEPIESSRDIKKELTAKQGHASVEIELLSESIAGIPAAFPVAAYENLVAELTKSGMFEHVWRQGDKRIDPNAFVLHINLEKLKAGSARARAMIPFTGATVLGIDLRLSDANGRVLFQKHFDAARRMRGESLEVTRGLSKKVCSELAELRELKDDGA